MRQISHKQYQKAIPVGEPFLHWDDQRSLFTKFSNNFISFLKIKYPLYAVILETEEELDWAEPVMPAIVGPGACMHDHGGDFVWRKYQTECKIISEQMSDYSPQ